MLVLSLRVAVHPLRFRRRSPPPTESLSAMDNGGGYQIDAGRSAPPRSVLFSALLVLDAVCVF